MSELADLASPEIDDAAPVLVVPVGATEQHGPHLPLSTDTEIAVALARRLAAAVAGVVVAPPIAYGSSGEHQSFAGTLSIGHRAVELVLLELGRSASTTFPRVVFVSTHGGNAQMVARAVRRLRADGCDVRAWSPATAWAGGDAHAGHTETSVMLALDPSRVRTTAMAPGEVRPLAAIMKTLRARGVVAVSANGVLGDPTAASRGEGERLLATAVDELAAAVRDWPLRDGAWL